MIIEGWVKRGMESFYLMGTEFQFGRMKMSVMESPMAAQ